MKPEDSTYSRILITGGAGFIGSHLTGELLSRGRTVYVLDDLSGGTLHHLNCDCERLTFRKMDIGCAMSDTVMMKKLTGIVGDVDIVYHLASPIGVARSHRQRLETTRRILSDGLSIVRACTECRTPLVFTSSSEVYGRGGEEPCREISVSPLGLEPRWGYGTAKLAVEHLVAGLYMENGIPTWIVRFFNIVGPRQRPATNLVFPVFCSSALENSPLVVYGNGTQQRNFLHVRDAVEALRIIPAYSNLCGEPANVGNDHTVSIMELAQQIIQTYDSKSPVVFRDYDAVFGAGFVPVFCRKPDLTRMYQFTNWKPKHTLTDAILDYRTQISGRCMYQPGMAV